MPLSRSSPGFIEETSDPRQRKAVDGHDNALGIDGVLTIDATAFYRIGDVRLRIHLKNLTNREYFLRGFGSNSVIPAPSFTAYFGFEMYDLGLVDLLRVEHRNYHPPMLHRRYPGLSFLAILALAACGGESSGKRFLSVGTAPPGGAFFVVGGALAETLGEHGPGWQVTAEATKGSQENIRRLDAGEIDVALSNASITYFAVRGEEGWEKPYPVASVMTLAPNVAMFLTPKSSAVKTIADLKGKRVVVGPSGAGWETFVSRILAAHGVTFADITPLNNTQTAAVDMLTDGSAAAAILGGAVPTASIVQATTSQDILLVPFDDAARKRLIAEYPFFEEQVIRAGTYKGQDEDFYGLDVGSMHLITSANADEELIYQVTKTIYENRESVVGKHPAGEFINAENAVRDTGTPFHPGAIRYYREIGIWPETES